MKIYHRNGLILILGLLYSCGGGSLAPESDEPSPDASRTVFLAADVVEGAGITFGSIEPKMLSHDISARGQILLLPGKRAVAAVMMGGVVQSIQVIYGQHVKKGEVLATYTHPDIINLQQHYINAKLELDVMEKEYRRQESLWKDGVKSDREYQESKLEYEKARADYNASKANVAMMNINVDMLDRGEVVSAVPIVSPIAGKVEDINISVGQYVEKNDPLFLVIDASSPVLQLKVFEKDIYLIEKGQRVTFSSPTSGLEEYEAEIFNVGSLVDPDARIIYVMAEITSRITDMIPGMFVSSTVHTREQYLDALPESAVVIENDNTKYGFYSEDPEGSAAYHFHPILLRTGFMEEGYVEVYPEEELPEGARMVMTGVYYLKSEMMKLLGD